MIKNKLFKVISGVLMAGILVTANGYAASASDTKYVDCPRAQSGMQWITIRHNVSSSSKTIKGANSFAYFKSAYPLPKEFQLSTPARTRYFSASLYEYDVDPNKDDEVKQYKGTFSGRVLDNVQATTIKSGNIDSEGDNVGEFYIKGKISQLCGDTNVPYSKGTFQYRIKAN